MEEAIKDIKKTLRRERYGVERLDSEKHKLESRLQDIEKERQQAEQIISDYEAVLQTLEVEE